MRCRNHLFAMILLLPFISMAHTRNQTNPASDNDSIIANTSSEMSPFDNTNRQLVTICGSRETSLRQVALYHCIIFYPEGEFIAHESKTSTQGGVATLTDTWKIQRVRLRGQRGVQEGALTIRYNAGDKSISMGSEGYSVAKGNMFVIRLDEGGRAKVRQVLATLNEA